MTSVCEILGDKYSMSARPGSKLECPFCGHRTMSIASSDKVAKCFHPKCGLAITSSKGDGQLLFEAMERMYRTFHNCLLDMASAPGKNAYDYCIRTRGLHPSVVADSMLGAMPSNFDVEGFFKPYIDRADDMSDNAVVDGGSAKAVDGAASQVELLEKAQEKLKAILEPDGNAGVKSGWVAMFYTDVASRIVAARFRKWDAPIRTIRLFNNRSSPSKMIRWLSYWSAGYSRTVTRVGRSRQVISAKNSRILLRHLENFRMLVTQNGSVST
jgi:hypothetical protein